MTEATTQIITTLAAVLAVDAEEILAQSLQRFVVEQIGQAQQRLSQGYLAQQRFVQKYGMSLHAFLQNLEAVEEQPEENVTIHGVPLLEALADSRWWAHVQEALDAETHRLAQLQALQR